ncbi:MULTISPECIES: hypothetical protein [Pseudomonas]|uniref:hypothetical protein n=1 Tax=Pseudomonas TaxID=286 RepID=UPI00087EA1FD|nr:MULTISPECIES: hypothetical protein [Pseudomonas]MBH3424444.1 hypothetical protein [Pseudomonas gessardii]MRU50186.1 hypothetical protein [Pseudomonas gessardii]NNA67236.1 hypothetical protein [Pseudomonas gessardii]ONH46089.1 hypothetical protein BLL38_07500 [Pseudomonas gessardii]PHN54742.1 hypothetical protein AO268_23375 [Pseudomonas sp. ICMP 8385]
MTDSRHPQDPTDEGLIQHFRQHSASEPSASLDAFILATARREAPTPAPSLWQRWLHACQRPRWQMAFATVAGVALLIGVVMRSPVPDLNQPEVTQYAAAPPPQALSAPAAPAPMARMAMVPQADSTPVQTEMAAVMADEPVAKMSKQMAAKPQSLKQGLEEIVRLRRAGESRAADEKLLALHKRFPEENLPARLEALQKR